MTEPKCAIFPGMTRLRPRSMVFTLFGDYAYPRGGGQLWFTSLVRIASQLGIGETAIRSAVARLARQGWISARKSGNRSYYILSPAGRRLLDEGTRRIYRADHAPWNGTWCVLTYSIPESRRALRDSIRKQLAWLGFGPIAGGAYISPRNVASAVQALSRRHEVQDFVKVFLSKLAGPADDRRLAQQCWDIPSIGQRYQEFLEHYQPMYRRDFKRISGDMLRDADAFAVRFALTHDFRRFPFIDPGLPETLLPARWPGRCARRLFDEYRAMLSQSALRYFDLIGVAKRHDRRNMRRAFAQ